MTMNIILGMFGAPEIILILVVILIFFGGAKIPELMRGLGKGVKEFKNATKDEEKGQESKKEEEVK
jgi:sec-independent protein translocase protein TatA